MTCCGWITAKPAEAYLFIFVQDSALFYSGFLWSYGIKTYIFSAVFLFIFIFFLLCSNQAGHYARSCIFAHRSFFLKRSLGTVQQPRKKHPFSAADDIDSNTQFNGSEIRGVHQFLGNKSIIKEINWNTWTLILKIDCGGFMPHVTVGHPWKQRRINVTGLCRLPR